MIVLDLHDKILNTDWLCESITRARNHVFIVTRPEKSSHPHLQVLGSAVDHGNESGSYECSVCSGGSKRSFVGMTLVERAFGGNTLVKVDGEVREVRETRINKQQSTQQQKLTINL